MALLNTALQIVTDPSQIRFEKVVSYGIAGAAYNVAAYSNTASKTGDSWQLQKASRTLYLGLLAGGIVAITDPEGGLTPQNFETAMYLAIPIADQLMGGGANLLKQIEHNQFAQWGEDWFYSGETPQDGNRETPGSGPGTGTIDPEQYFDAVSPDEDDDPEDPSTE